MGNMMMGMISEPFGNVVTTSIKTRGNYGYFMENHLLWTPPNRGERPGFQAKFATKCAR
jgi:hypothetical protein